MVLVRGKPSGEGLWFQRQEGGEEVEVELRSRVGGMGASVPRLVPPERTHPERVCRAGPATGNFTSRARTPKHFFRAQG